MMAALGELQISNKEILEKLLALPKKSPRAPQEQEMVKREIESMDKAIDRLVYELSSTGVIYRLSEETQKQGDEK